MDSGTGHIRHVLRRCRRAPLVSAVTLATLAIVIGGNTAVFGLLESVLLKPLPYPHAEELVSISHSAPGLNIDDVGSGACHYFVYRSQSTAFQHVGLYSGDSVNEVTKTEPQRVRALRVTEDILPLLGVQPIVGRRFERADDQPGAPGTALLTYGHWQRQFAGDPSVVGRTIRVDGEAATIIGVLPGSFHFLSEEDPALVLPLRLDPAKALLGHFNYHAIGRLKPGIALPAASADIARMLPTVLRSFPAPPGYSVKDFEAARFTPVVVPLKDEIVGDIAPALWVVMGSLGVVLLIACANIANLLLVRLEGRRHELAIRAAIGATRRDITIDLLLESELLACAGSAIGLGLAGLLLRALAAAAPANLPRIGEVGIDGRVVLFTALVALGAGLLSGAIPIWRVGSLRRSVGVRDGERGNTQSRGPRRTRGVLVVGQVALALVLLVCSGLMGRTFVEMTRVERGFSSPATLQTFVVSIPQTQVADSDAVARAFDAILRRIAEVPGVSSAGIASRIPLDGTEEGFERQPAVRRRPRVPGRRRPSASRQPGDLAGLLRDDGDAPRRRPRHHVDGRLRPASRRARLGESRPRALARRLTRDRQTGQRRPSGRVA